MKHTSSLPSFLATATLVAVSLTADLANAQSAPLFRGFNFAERTIGGSFVGPNGQTYTARLLLDEADYRTGTTHSVFIKPEDYRVVTDFNGAGQRINCPFDGPGVKTIEFAAPPVVECTWKQGNGSRAPSGTVTLRGRSAANPITDLPQQTPITKSDFIQFGETTIGGTSEVAPGSSVEFSLLLDRFDYRNGNSHKVWAKPQDYQVRTVANNYAGQIRGIRCTSNDGAAFTSTTSGSIAISAGKAPVVTCTWADGPSSAAVVRTVVLD